MPAKSWIDGKLSTYMPPHKRDIGMVFQNYALFPHMTRRREHRLPAADARHAAKPRSSDESTRVLDVGAACRPGGSACRAQLSGGQQQRVALARCIVYEPPIMLMDEPLGALDKKLREQMQLEIKRLHRQLGITVLYVTHDQEEALTMSDRIA